MEKLQVGEEPEHAPVHLTKDDPGDGEAVRVTAAPAGSTALHPAVDPEEQLTPPPLTVPLPLPAVLTARA